MNKNGSFTTSTFFKIDFTQNLSEESKNILISRIFFAKLTGRNWIVFTFDVFNEIIGLVSWILEHSVWVAGRIIICRIEKTIFHGCPSNLLLLTTHDTMNKTRRIPCKGRVSRKKEAFVRLPTVFSLDFSALASTLPHRRRPSYCFECFNIILLIFCSTKLK